jgi:hypothetical protein
LILRPPFLEAGTEFEEGGIISLVLAERLLELTINLLNTCLRYTRQSLPMYPLVEQAKEGIRLWGISKTA